MNSRDAIDKLITVLNKEDKTVIVWHKNCYAQYTDKGNYKGCNTSHKDWLPVQLEQVLLRTKPLTNENQFHVPLSSPWTGVSVCSVNLCQESEILYQ